MNSRKSEILQIIIQHPKGLTANEVAELLNIDRSNVSRYLNELFKEERIQKSDGRPVIYQSISNSVEEVHVDTSSFVTFDNLVGAHDSLKVSI